MEAKLPKEKSEERKAEVRESFHRMLEYAKENGVAVIMIAGDLFDSDRPLKKDKEFFYSAVKNNPELDFLYLRGNHDGMESYTEDLPNLKTFGGEWTKYSYGEVDIYGIETAAENATSMYATFRADEKRKNIVMLHGQVGEVSGVDKVHISKLRDKNIDYLALGHIHSYSHEKLDERGVYSYCGCLEGRGFDELGEKGFVYLEIEDSVMARFVPHSKRKIEERKVDITGSEDGYEAYQKTRAYLAGDCQKKDLLRLTLTGDIDFDNETLAKDVEGYLSSDYYFVSVKDKTLRRFDVDALAGDISLRGEFIRTVLANEKLDELQKREVIAMGLKALSGREVDA
jgi:DNA repair exonuclease SbcCD nuclease subunit